MKCLVALLVCAVFAEGIVRYERHIVFPDFNVHFRSHGKSEFFVFLLPSSSGSL